MLNFKQYLKEEFTSTKRQGIIHFQDMKPIVAYKFLKSLKEDYMNQLKDIPIQLKIDGSSFRFGKDSNGKFFVETGSSGIIQKQKAFSTYTKQNTKDKVRIERAGHYDDIYDVLQDSSIWHDLPNDTKIICEILFNPMAEDHDAKLKFVKIKYDKKKLGKIMTIIPISVVKTSSGKHLDKDIIDDLIKKSDEDIKIISPKLPNLTIDVTTELAPLKFIDDNVEQVLKSLKQKDKSLKQEYITILNGIKAEIADQILKYPIKGKNMLGNDIEGIILELDGKLYKMTEQSFKDAKKAEKLLSS